ncbi:glutaredoxin-1 [Strongylocentrotus purpuratus]|uniref:Glutaredoxin-1 n=1 Tax=Strongylocentrotus purpuratus TaxID=7668 RepID=A0A7M7RC15_STRPU|nr:glutaredoxin-1 [Strongylocentrotus purpuratus]|eukprot:XP_787379.1 PREDICTED: glutaredoxin-1 [Strongylocentrotus purpuratus]
MAQTFVDAQIRDNKVVMFSKTFCPYCKMAKDSLASAGLKDYKVVELENHNMCAEIQDYLNKLTGARSVPRVFIGGKCIGGGSETKALQESGKLTTMLQQNGAM